MVAASRAIRKEARQAIGYIKGLIGHRDFASAVGEEEFKKCSNYFNLFAGAIGSSVGIDHETVTILEFQGPVGLQRGLADAATLSFLKHAKEQDYSVHSEQMIIGSLEGLRQTLA